MRQGPGGREGQGGRGGWLGGRAQERRVVRGGEGRPDENGRDERRNPDRQRTGEHKGRPNGDGDQQRQVGQPRRFLREQWIDDADPIDRLRPPSYQSCRTHNDQRRRPADTDRRPDVVTAGRHLICDREKPDPTKREGSGKLPTPTTPPAPGTRHNTHRKPAHATLRSHTHAPPRQQAHAHAPRPTHTRRPLSQRVLVLIRRVFYPTAKRYFSVDFPQTGPIVRVVARWSFLSSGHYIRFHDL